MEGDGEAYHRHLSLAQAEGSCNNALLNASSSEFGRKFSQITERLWMWDFLCLYSRTKHAVQKPRWWRNDGLLVSIRIIL